MICSSQVYPRRFELLTEQEDKLTKLYASKLEQLHALTARLASLAETLGKHFYSSEVLKPAPASGQKEHADSWRDVTPEHFNWLEKELTRGRAEVVRYFISIRLARRTGLIMHVDTPFRGTLSHNGVHFLVLRRTRRPATKSFEPCPTNGRAPLSSRTHRTCQGSF